MSTHTEHELDVRAEDPAVEAPDRPEGGQPVAPPSPSDATPFGAPASPRRRLLWGIGFAGVLAVAVVGVVLATRDSGPAPAPAGHNHGAAASESKANPVMLDVEGARRIGVTFAPVVSEPLAGEVRTVGLVTYDETRVSVIAPKLDGWIERLYVNITGAPVRRGDPLFAIYSPMLVTAQEELLLAHRLARDVAAGTPDAAQGAASLVESARRRLAYWDIPADEIAQLERTGQVRKTLTLRSPVDGVVLEKSVVQGQRIMAGDAVFRIADLRVVWLEGEVFERDLPAVRVGQPVTVDLQAAPGAPRSGRITYIYPTINTETRTARLRVALSNVDAMLKPGMYATIRVGTRSAAPAVTVPRSAVLATGERTLVFVKDRSGSLIPRDVVVGRSTDERLEIVRGVVPGDTVVASATFLIDAESNLGSAMGGMGNMPGMDVSAPAPAGAPKAAPPTAPATPKARDGGSARPPAPMPDMPGMPAPANPHAGHGG